VTLGAIVSVKLPLAGAGNVAGAAKVLFDSLGLGLANRRVTLLLGRCIPTLAGHLLQVTFGFIVSFKLPIALAEHTTGLAKVLFGGLDVGLGGALIFRTCSLTATAIASSCSAERSKFPLIMPSAKAL
jgi:hypothetical protein